MVLPPLTLQRWLVGSGHIHSKTSCDEICHIPIKASLVMSGTEIRPAVMVSIWLLVGIDLVKRPIW